MAQVEPVHEKGWMSFPIAGHAAHGADAAGSVGVVKNPEGAPIIITKCIAYIKTGSTGVANLTVGKAATIAGAHDAHELFDALAVQAAGVNGHAYSGHATGDAGDDNIVVAADEYIGAWCSADSSGLVGRIFVEYVRAE